MVKNQRGLCQIVLFCLLDPKSLVKFCRLNKNCNQLLDPRSKYCVNFKVLFEEQFGIQLKPAEEEETLISTARALQWAAKYMMLRSIIKSQQIIAKRNAEDVTGTVTIPEVTTLADQSYRELRNLRITQVLWNGNCTFGLTLSCGQSCQAGSKYDCDESHTFDQSKKITKVECIID